MITTIAKTGDTYVIVGKKVSADIGLAIGHRMGEGESAVEIPSEILEAAVRNAISAEPEKKAHEEARNAVDCNVQQQ